MQGLRCLQHLCKDSVSHLRHFSAGQVLFARSQQRSKIRVPSKKAQAAKQRRKAANLEKLDAKKEKLTLLEAISVLRALEVGRPHSCYELFVRTSLGPGTTVPKGRVNLPREPKARTEDLILVFAEGRQAEEAKRAGAHIVGGAELIEGILNKRFRATTILSTTAMIKGITPRLGRYLGPLGMMPSERRGTVTDDVAGYIQRLQGSREWKADRTGNIRTAIARMEYPVEDVVRNFRQFMLSVKKVTGNAKEGSDRKGNAPVIPIRKVMLSSPQGPGIRIADF